MIKWHEFGCFLFVLFSFFLLGDLWAVYFMALLFLLTTLTGQLILLLIDHFI